MFSTHSQVVGAEQPESLTSVLTALAELRGSANFSLEAEVDQVVGRAVAAMGPARLLAAIPLNITGQGKNYGIGWPGSWRPYLPI